MKKFPRQLINKIFFVFALSGLVYSLFSLVTFDPNSSDDKAGIIRLFISSSITAFIFGTLLVQAKARKRILEK